MSKRKKAAKVVVAQRVREPRRDLVSTMRVIIPGANGSRMVFAAPRIAPSGIQARRGSYRGANNPRTRTQTPFGGSGDQHADPWTRRIMREISRDMERNAGAYSTMLDEYARVMVGDGVRALCRSKDENWNKLAGDWLHRKCLLTGVGSIDSRQRQSHYAQQAEFVRSTARDGDCLMIRRADFRIQMVEADQVTSGPAALLVGGTTNGMLSYADGVHMDDDGATIFYTVCPYDERTGSIALGQPINYPADVCSFAAIKTRISQTRGIPLLVSGMVSFERLDSFMESEVIAAEQGSQIYGAVEYPEGNMGYAGTYGAQSPSTGNDSQPPTPGFSGGLVNAPQGNIDWHETVAGAVIELPDGKKYVPINPQRPNRDAAPFMIELLRQFNANGGLPYEITYNDLRGLSWNVQRGMVQAARDKIVVPQNLIYAPVFRDNFRWMLANAIASGELPMVEGWDQLDLLFPRISWPDEGKEFEAQKAGLRGGLTTRHRIFGPDWRSMIDEQMIELEYATEKVVQYNKRFPDFKMKPQELLGLVDHGDESTMDGGDEVKAPGKKTKNPEEVES